MKKFLYVAAMIVVLLPLSASAVFNEVGLESGTILNFPGNGLNYLVGSSLRGIQSFAVNDSANRFELGVTANSLFIMSSENKSTFTVTNNSCNGVSIECQSDKSVMTIDCSNGPSDHTIYIVPGAANTCSGTGSSGGNTGGGGPSGGGSQPPPPPPAAKPAVPATPATPAVPGVSAAKPAVPATPATPAVVFKSQLQQGSNNSEVKALQEKLQQLGFLAKDITPNGNFGPKTAEAVRKFQAANALAQVGFVGPGTRAALNGTPAVASTPAASAPASAPAATPAPAAGGAAVTFKSFMAVGSKNDEVKSLQIKLQALGFLGKDVTPTGYFGSKTSEAVKKFQAANGIDQVGFVGPGTRAVLNK